MGVRTLTTRLGRLVCRAILATGVLAWATGTAGEVVEENLAPIRTPPRVSWVEHDWGYTVRDGVLKLVGGEKGPASYRLASPWFPKYVAAQDVIVRFSCRGDAKSPYVMMNTRAMERCGEGKANYQERHFQPTAEWKPVEIRLPFPQTDAWGYDFCLRVGKGAGTLEVRDADGRSVPCAVRTDPSGAKSLAHLLVIVPTAQSGRRLRLKLAERLGAVVPPEIRLLPFRRRFVLMRRTEKKSPPSH